MNMIHNSRHEDLRQIERDIRSGKLGPDQLKRAKRARQMILNESKEVKSMRDWIYNEQKHGRYENVKNAYESAEMDPRYQNREVG